MSGKKKIYFIINPISGTQKKDLIIKDINRYLDNSRFDYEVKYTQYAGHAAAIAREAANAGLDIVVAIGGDGTVNEVARSFVVGDQALEIDKFDNLIRAGESEDLQEIPEIEIIAVLRQIALATKNIPYCKRADISTDYGEEEENRVLQHLEDREVLEKKGDDNYKIQVKLFQEWLLNH